MLVAAATALALGSNIKDAIVLAVESLGFAFTHSVPDLIFRHDAMRTTISWITIVAIRSGPGGLFKSGLRMLPTLPQ